ncbi:phage tail assembly chaperone [Leuconostoc citreum]
MAFTVTTEKIKLNRFGLTKTVAVRMTMGQFDKMSELGIELLEHDEKVLENSENMTTLDYMRGERRVQKLMFDFMQDTFSLTDEEVAKIKDSIDPTQFKEAFSYITERLRVVTDKQYEEAVKREKALREKEAQEDPKEGSVELAD